MPKFFVKNNQVNFDKKEIKIINDDFNHLKNVLRCKINDEVEICIQELPSPLNYLCEIIEIGNDYMICKIREMISKKTESKLHIHIVQGLPKADKMEFIIQKCTELGVKEFTPLEMNRCIVKLNDKEREKKIIRWKKIAESAAKQCGRNIIPKVNSVINLKNLFTLLKNYDMIIVAYENEKQNLLRNIFMKLDKQKSMKIAIIIGPEGGITENEIIYLKENGAEIASLGNRILRTETVAIAISSILEYEFGDIG